MLTFVLFATAAQSVGAIPCPGVGPSQPPTFAVIHEGASVLEVRPSGDEAYLCVNFGSCQWHGPLAPEQAQAITKFTQDSAGPDPDECAAYSTSARSEPPYESVIHTSCESSVPGVRPVIALRDFVAGLGATECSIEGLSSNATGDILLTSALTVQKEAICLSAAWSLSSASAAISLGVSCSGGASSSAPGRVTIEAHQGTSVVAWELVDQGGSWQVATPVSGTADYTGHWANAVSQAANATLQLPREDPLSGSDQGQHPAVLMLSRWAMAFAAPPDSYLDTELREWMASVQLRNPTTASRTLFRHECTRAPTLKSCIP